MLVQSLSAKLGIATGKNLAEVCRDHVPKAAALALWVQAEAVAMATDLAEILGASLGLHLLFGLPLLVAGLLAAVAAFLVLERRGFRRLEAAIASLVGVILASFALEAVFARPDPQEAAKHLLLPSFSGSESVLLAVGILGATVMPHVVYLHSALTQSRVGGRDERERRAIQRFERIDVVIAMGLAGAVNIAMLAIFGAVLHGSGGTSIPEAFRTLEREGGQRVALLFGVALLARASPRRRSGQWRGRS